MPIVSITGISFEPASRSDPAHETSPHSSPPPMRPDRIQRTCEHAQRAVASVAGAGRRSAGHAEAAVGGVAGSLGAAARLQPFIGAVGSRLAAAAGGMTRATLPFAGDVAGAAGLVLTIQSPAGSAGEDAVGASWRVGSHAVADRAPQRSHTAYPIADVAAGRRPTMMPVHVRDRHEGTLTTPAVVRTAPTFTGRESLAVGDLTEATGTAIHEPSALENAYLATPERVITPAHAVHLTPRGTLANADRATGVEVKLDRYSLDALHEPGKHKARVFKSVLGYDRANAAGLREQIENGVQRDPAAPGIIDEHGVRFTIDIPVTGPAGSATVRTGWIYDPGVDVLRMTTGYVK